MAVFQNQSEENHSTVGWAFWFKWVLASVIGLFLGLAISEIMNISILNFNFGLTSPFLGGAAGVLGSLEVSAGLAIGILQWLLLRKYISGAGWWVLASMVVLVVGQLNDHVIGFSAYGLGFGIAQWLVLRRSVPRSGEWIFASVAGWTLGRALGMVMFNRIGFVMGNATFGVIVGIITGGAMVWILRQLPQSENLDTGKMAIEVDKV
ncbi:MAG: hypothetical protein KAS38_19405 [Anaerolineales bacterium]|nr:hypothetical protein [Anaerolineales bacterium]